MIELRASDARHWTFCKRVVWHRLLAPQPTGETHKMAIGRDAERMLEALERRRTSRRYDLAKANRRFHVRLWSARLRVHGVCDLVLDVCEPRAVFPVEVKTTEGGVSRHHLVQLAGYASMLEETEGVRVDRGFVYVLPKDEVVEVRLDEELKGAFASALAEIRAMLESESFPEPTRFRSFCPQCEYVRFCGDVL